MPSRSWHDHRHRILAILLAALLVAVPGQLTRPLQSFWHELLAPGRRIAQVALASGASVVAHGRACVETADGIAARQQAIHTLAAEIQHVSAERDAALLELAQMRQRQSLDQSLDSKSAPLLTAKLAPARVLGPQSQTFLGRRQLIELGTKRGAEHDFLVVESPTAVLDQGRDQAIAAGQLVLSGRRIWGKIATASRWTSSVCYLGDAGYRDVILIVAANARNQQSGAVRGVLYGMDEPLCRVRYVSANQPVSVGDWVISAISDDLGCGPLCYGKIIRVEESAARADWEIWVEPAIPHHTVLQHVAVVCPEINPVRIGHKPATAEATR